MKEILIKEEIIMTGPSKRTIGGLKIIYDEKQKSCKILFKNKYSSLANNFVMMQIDDPYLHIKKITINGEEKDKLIFDLYKEKILEENVCEIFFKTEKDLIYDMGCLVYIENKNDPFLRDKLLDVWTKNS